MKQQSHLLPLMLLLATVGIATAGEAPKMKKFLTKPLVIEDQGSFFVGGVPKVTNFATVPGPNQPAVPNQIMIGQMYVQFQIPARGVVAAPKRAIGLTGLSLFRRVDAPQDHAL